MSEILKTNKTKATETSVNDVQADAVKEAIHQKNKAMFPEAYVDENKIKHSNIKLNRPDIIKDYPVLDKDGRPRKYSVALSDPCWMVQQTGARGAEQHYNLLPMEKIKALPMQDIMADDAAIFLWVTNAIVPYIKEIGDAWGFTYRSIITWAKFGRIGLGMYCRNNTEQLILMTRGKMLPSFKSQPTFIIDSVQDHSHKPESVYSMIERLYPDKAPYLEMFGRQRFSKAWHCWGYEAPGGSDIVIPGYPVPRYSFNLERLHPDIKKKLHNGNTGDGDA